MPTLVDQAIVIRVAEFSETSQTATLFLRDHGLIRGLAKGSRREKSRFSGGIEALTRGEIVAITKATTDLATLTEWDLQEVYWAVRRDLTAHRAGLYMADILQHAITDHDPHAALFDTMDSALRSLAQPGGHARAVLGFQWALLSETGYRPRLDADARAGAPLATATTYGFDAQAGGLVADPGNARPRPSPGNTPGPTRSASLWRVRSDTVEVLRRLEAGSPPDQLGSPETIDRAGRLLAAYLTQIMGRDLGTREALFGSL